MQAFPIIIRLVFSDLYGLCVFCLFYTRWWAIFNIIECYLYLLGMAIVNRLIVLEWLLSAWTRLKFLIGHLVCMSVTCKKFNIKSIVTAARN